jgi:hypothetical protein
MAKKAINADDNTLTAEQRVILFCAATGIATSTIGIQPRAVRTMVIRGLIERGYPGGTYALTAAGRAAFLALLEGAGIKPT